MFSLTVEGKNEVFVEENKVNGHAKHKKEANQTHQKKPHSPLQSSWSVVNQNCVIGTVDVDGIEIEGIGLQHNKNLYDSDGGCKAARLPLTPSGKIGTIRR